MDAWIELGHPATVGDAIVAADLGRASKLQAVLEELPGHDKRNALGNLLRDCRGRVVDGRKFEHTSRRPAKWQLLNIGQEAKA